METSSVSRLLGSSGVIARLPQGGRQEVKKWELAHRIQDRQPKKIKSNAHPRPRSIPPTILVYRQRWPIRNYRQVKCFWQLARELDKKSTVGVCLGHDVY